MRRPQLGAAIQAAQWQTFVLLALLVVAVVAICRFVSQSGRQKAAAADKRKS